MPKGKRSPRPSSEKERWVFKRKSEKKTKMSGKKIGGGVNMKGGKKSGKDKGDKVVGNDMRNQKLSKREEAASKV